MKGFKVGFNVVTSTNNLERSSNVKALNNSGIDTPSIKPGIKLSQSTVGSLDKPEPGSFMDILNKGFGLVDYKC